MHSSNIAPSTGFSAQNLQLNVTNTSLIVTKKDFQAMISGLDDPIGNQIFDEIWKALIASTGHVACDAQLQFNTSPLKIDKEALKATIGGLGSPVGDQAFDVFWESLVERVQSPAIATTMRKKMDEASRCCVNVLYKTDNAGAQNHHGGDKGNQTNINSVSKQRKADSDIVEPDSDIESCSKKQKSAPEVHDSTVIDGVDDALLLRGVTKCVHRVTKTLKRMGSTTNSAKADEIALTPYKHPYFTHAEILRDDALYAPLPTPEPQPTTFFGTEEDKRLRNLFPAFASSEDRDKEEGALAIFEGSKEGRMLKRMEEEARWFEKGVYESLLVMLWRGVMEG